VLSLVVPTLNAARGLERSLASVRGGVDEIVVADGGSTDGTLALAEGLGARVLSVPPGRGGQLAAGAREAKGDWLLFLHADTALANGWRAVALAHRRDRPERAGFFRLALDDPNPAARRVESLANWRARRLGLPYGDQGLLISRALYEAVGGFRGLPLMEDVDLVRRIGKSRLVPLDAEAVTSAERYRRDGWWRRPMRNLACLGLYFLGVPPRRIQEIYR
jgi:rSAM/selenodomain-associated transferase 2